jgi:hypothetical protein
MPLIKSETTTPNKKLKTTEVDSLEKKRRVENFKTFMNRGGPDAPGAPNCLKKFAFVISGKRRARFE